jgi:hypothetical protein
MTALESDTTKKESWLLCSSKVFEAYKNLGTRVNKYFLKNLNNIIRNKFIWSVAGSVTANLR